jgi:hypothetical protein
MHATPPEPSLVDVGFIGLDGPEQIVFAPYTLNFYADEGWVIHGVAPVSETEGRPVRIPLAKLKGWADYVKPGDQAEVAKEDAT